MSVFLMAGGGTGGHVIPGLAVARELARRGHEPVFVGTRKGYEARLVPAAGFRLELIEIGGLNRVGVRQMVKSFCQLPLSVMSVMGLIRRLRPAAVFSMGGYAAGPVMIGAKLRGVPVVVMEANALPGFTSRKFGRWADRALLGFEETARFFPSGISEVTGLPVRPEFFALQPKPREEMLTVLITGGSRGSRTLNQAARGSWALFRASGAPVRIVHQTGEAGCEEIAQAFAESGMEGEVISFIPDMAAAFARADMVIGRSGAGAVSELAAAGKPAILVPFPFAADDHQYFNAKAMMDAGAARLVRDEQFTGERLFREVMELAGTPGLLERMSRAAKKLAKPGAAERAATILEGVSAAFLSGKGMKQ